MMKPSVQNIDEILHKMNADQPGDIIADIMHWCDHYGEDFGNLLLKGLNYYNDEINEDNG